MKKRLSIIGVPSDLGANIKGSRLGPTRIRKYLIPFLKKNKIKYKDYGDSKIPKDKKIRFPHKKHFTEIKNICHNFFIKTFSIDNSFPIILGGDHSITACFIERIALKRKIGLIYFDAHGDFNIPKTTLTGNIHGMVVSIILGRLSHILDIDKSLIKQRNIILIGVRDLDPKEKVLLENSNIKVFDIKSVRELGIDNVVKKAIKIASKGTEGFHLSIDLDVIDPKYAPGVSTPVKNGLSKNEMIRAIKIIKKSKILSADFVELNPLKDNSDKTAKLVVELIRNLI